MLSKQSKISCHRQAKLQQQTEEKYKKNLKDMCTRGKEKKKEFSKIFRSLNGPQLPPAQKITRGGQNNTSVTSVKTRLIKHARNHSINHNIVPPLYGHQDRIEEVIAESMTGGQKRYIVQWADTYMLRQMLGAYSSDVISVCWAAVFVVYIWS